MLAATPAAAGQHAPCTLRLLLCCLAASCLQCHQALATTPATTRQHTPGALLLAVCCCRFKQVAAGIEQQAQWAQPVRVFRLLLLLLWVLLGVVSEDKRRSCAEWCQAGTHQDHNSKLLHFVV
jgi:hypothetical protein